MIDASVHQFARSLAIALPLVLAWLSMQSLAIGDEPTNTQDPKASVSTTPRGEGDVGVKDAPTPGAPQPQPPQSTLVPATGLSKNSNEAPASNSNNAAGNVPVEQSPLNTPYAVGQPKPIDSPQPVALSPGQASATTANEPKQAPSSAPLPDLKSTKGNVGAAPQPESKPQSQLNGGNATTKPESDKNSAVKTELEIKARMAAAKAYMEADKKDKAIEALEKALLAAPNEDTRKSIRAALDSTTPWYDTWTSPIVSVLRPIISWAVLALALVALIWFVYRVGYDGKETLLVTPGHAAAKSDLNYCDYLRLVISKTHHDFGVQSQLMKEIGELGASTIWVSPQIKVLASLMPLELPIELESSWLPLVRRLNELLLRPTFTVKVSVFENGDSNSILVDVKQRGESLAQIHVASDKNNLATATADLAYRIVSTVLDARTKQPN